MHTDGRYQQAQYARLRSDLKPEDPDAKVKEQQAKQHQEFLLRQIAEKRMKQQSERQRNRDDDEKIARAALREEVKKNEPIRQEQQLAKLEIARKKEPEDAPMTYKTATESLNIAKGVYVSRIPRPTYLLHIHTTAGDIAEAKLRHGCHSHKQHAKQHSSNHEYTTYVSPYAAKPVAAAPKYEPRVWPKGTKVPGNEHEESMKRVQPSYAQRRTEFEKSSNPIHPVKVTHQLDSNVSGNI